MRNEINPPRIEKVILYELDDQRLGELFTKFLKVPDGSSFI